MLSKLGMILTGVTMVFAMTSVHADDQITDESVSVIQNRIYDRFHEIDFVLGYVPDDDFYTAFPIGLSYTYHFNEHIAWEVMRGQVVINADRDLKETLRDEYSVAPTEFDKITSMFHSNFVFKPAYGKDAIMNSSIINHETYMLAGLGVFNYERSYSDGSTTAETAGSISMGIGRKYFINQTYSLNLELRDYISFKESGTENNLYLGISIGYRFNMAPRINVRKKEAESIYRYLKDDNEGLL